MKAKIIIEMVCDRVNGIAGQSYPIKKILIPEENNLVITLHGNNLYVLDNFQRTDDCETVKEIEIPDKLVAKAVDLMNSRDYLLKQFQKFIEG